MPNFKGIRESFYAKIAVYLQETSRDMSLFPDLDIFAGTIYPSVTIGGTQFGVAMRMPEEAPFYPGINITFLGENDDQPFHHKKKRFNLPVKIRITKEVGAADIPTVAQVDALDAASKIYTALEDGYVEVWNYSDPSFPVDTGMRGRWKGTPIVMSDESMIMEGGDIRLEIDLDINYQSA